MNWFDFFPPESRVQAMPSWSSPRLYIPAGSIRQSWIRSAFFPAYRKSAMVYRYFLRAMKTLPFGARATPSKSGSWSVGDFLNDVTPDVTSISLLVGTEGPAQKMTLQLCNQSDHIVGYIKYGESDAAISGIKNEAATLSLIPTGLGPRLLKADSFASGFALVTSSIEGSAVPASLPPVEPVLDFQDQLILSDSHPISEHPGIVPLLGDETTAWIENLANRNWPSAIQHGDYAPWNLKLVDGNVKAFDWEYATMNGFPYLDSAFFSLQTDVKIYKANPVDAFQRARKILERFSGLDQSHTASLVRLAAFDAYRKGLADGHKPGDFLQEWYRGVWEAAA